MAVVHHRTDVDLHLNQTLRTRVQNVSALPAAVAGSAGWLVYHVGEDRLYISDGSTFTPLDTGVGDIAFEHVQSIPQSVITVLHNLGFRPTVSAFALDFDTQFTEFTTQHLDANSLRVSMENPQACVLVMS